MNEIMDTKLLEGAWDISTQCALVMMAVMMTMMALRYQNTKKSR